MELSRKCWMRLLRSCRNSSEAQEESEPGAYTRVCALRPTDRQGVCSDGQLIPVAESPNTGSAQSPPSFYPPTRRPPTKLRFQLPLLSPARSPTAFPHRRRI